MIPDRDASVEEVAVELTEREKKVLYLTVYFHIATGEPVGSRFLSKKLDLDVSAATVRNVMADLEEKGLLKQIHSSSGRIPTNLGYRRYVDLLIKRERPNETAVREIRQRFSVGHLSVDDVFQDASRTLSSVSRQLGLVVGPKYLGDSLKRLQFVKVSRRRVLAVIVSGNGLVQNKVFELTEDWRQEELNAMSEIWNKHFSAMPVREVRAELLDRIAADKEEFDHLMEAALTLGRQALLEEEREESLYLEGAANMLSWQEFASPAKLRRLMVAIEEKSRLLHLLDRSIRSDGIQVFIGEEMPIPEMKEMSLIAAPYGPPGHVLGVLGVIGPTRMEYSRVIPIVEYMAISLSDYLSVE
jgi:heat-inducible transcriptional repressor